MIYRCGESYVGFPKKGLISLTFVRLKRSFQPGQLHHLLSNSAKNDWLIKIPSSPGRQHTDTFPAQQRNGADTGPYWNRILPLPIFHLILLGQSRSFYQYAAQLMGSTDEDKLAYPELKGVRNLLITRTAQRWMGFTILRQYLFSQFQYLLFEQLATKPGRTAGGHFKGIEKYHLLRWSSGMASGWGRNSRKPPAHAACTWMKYGIIQVGGNVNRRQHMKMKWNVIMLPLKWMERKSKCLFWAKPPCNPAEIHLCKPELAVVRFIAT